MGYTVLLISILIDAPFIHPYVECSRSKIVGFLVYFRVIISSTYMLFTSREVRIGKNCARGLGYRRRPRAVSKTEGTVFAHTDRPRLVNNIFIFF